MKEESPGFNRGECQVGMHAIIIKGRYKGGKGVVEELQPIRNRYGRTVAWYARLDNGTRTNITNLQPDKETS